MRDFWRGHASCGQFAVRLAGSSDLYESDGRDPFASINFITAHDGFTLADLVAYDVKHNEANLEDGRDGSDDNRSWNCGVEGPTEDPDVLALRARQRRNFLTTLMVSQGTPMLLGGDELARTQHGNNNPWCQDNELSWFDWGEAPDKQALHAFTKRLIALRRQHPVFRREAFLRGRKLMGSDLPDVWWFRGDGRRMTRRDWQDGERVLGMFLNGRGIPSRSATGAPIRDDSFVVLFNAEPEPRSIMLPRRGFGAQWALELSTADPAAEPGSARYGARTEVPMAARSVTMLRRAS
jgi:glycogen operon protein